MALHDDPKTAAEEFALHLEKTYGVQLDFARHRALVAEIEDYGKSEVSRAQQQKKAAKKEKK